MRGLSVVEFVWSLSGGWLWSGICLILVMLLEGGGVDKCSSRHTEWAQVSRPKVLFVFCVVGSASGRAEQEFNVPC